LVTETNATPKSCARRVASRIPQYCGHLKNGRANGKAVPVVARDAKAACLVDARGGLAYLASAIAVKEAIKRAQRHGVAFAGITNSHHFGAAGYHLRPIAEAGLVGLAFTNSPSAINAWGGKRPFYGTNPVAATFPRKGSAPVVVDLALTEVVRGKIMLAANEGKPIPLGWALDRDGNPTTDAQAALTGAAFSFENDSYFEPGNKPRIGHAILAIDPEALAGSAVYFERIETMISRMLEDKGVRLPGVRRHAAVAAASEHGIEIPQALHEELQKLASR
jgi:(2R)-3-sulfolactate dehydrogenase (NADP+)